MPSKKTLTSKFDCFVYSHFDVEWILNVKLSKKFQNCFSPNLDQLGSIVDARVRADEQDLKNATENNKKILEN